MNESQQSYQQQLRTMFSEYIENVLKRKWEGNPNPDFNDADPKAWVVKHVPGDWEDFTFSVDPKGYGCKVNENGENCFSIQLPGAPKPPSDLAVSDVTGAAPIVADGGCSCSCIVCCCCC